MSEVCVICNRCTRRLWPDISSCLFAILFIHITNKLKRRLLIFHLALTAPLSTSFTPPDSDFLKQNQNSFPASCRRRCMNLFTPILYIPCGSISQSLLDWTPPPRAIVNSERPCDALIVEVTGMSAEYAKPPVNPIKWSELPVVWRELAICFQDLSRRRSKVLLARAGRHLWQENGRNTVNYMCRRGLIKEGSEATN